MKLIEVKFWHNSFQNFLIKNKFNIFWRNVSLGVTFAELFNRTKEDLIKKQFFEPGDGNWVDILPTIKEQYKNRAHSSTRLSPIQASLKKNEGLAYKNLLDKPKKMKAKFQVSNLVRRTDLKKSFSIVDTTNWSFKLYKVTEISNDSIPSYRIDNLPDCYKEALLKKN